MSAAFFSHLAAIELLLVHKANCHAVDVHGRTALSIALETADPSKNIIGRLQATMAREKQILLGCILHHVRHVKELSCLVYEYSYGGNNVLL